MRTSRGTWRALPLTILVALLGGCAAAPDLVPVQNSATVASLGTAPASCPAPKPDAPGAKKSRLPLRSLCALPKEAATVWQKIKSNARLHYPKDGSTFNNAEQLLPRQNRGYYLEYTVPTPGSHDRGTRRLVTGSAQEVYYTADHYQSFVAVDSTAVGTG